MKVGHDQTIARDLNMELILGFLKNDYLSSSDLAKKLKLSKAALTKIMNEMIELNLVMISHKDNNKSEIGRKKTYFKINPQAGMIVVINFASTYIKVIISTLDNTVIDEASIEAEFIRESDLEKVASIVNKFKKKYETETTKLLTICIAAPGQINKFTQEFKKSPKFMYCGDIKIKDYFKEKCQTDTLLKNDINLFIVGEKEHGSISEEIQDAILIHIDSGIGGAIYNKNQVVDGENGFAGEFGLMKTYDNFGNLVPYDAICSTNSIKNRLQYLKFIGEDPKLKENFRFKDVVEAFHNGNEIVRTVVLESAKKISNMVSDLYNIFDYSHIYISGRIKMFGHEYINEIKSHLNILDRVNLQYTKLNDEAVVYGALSVASRYTFKKLLEIRKKNNVLSVKR